MTITEEQHEIEVLAEKLFVAMVGMPDANPNVIDTRSTAQYGKDVARSAFELAGVFVMVRDEMRQHMQD